MRVIHSYSVPGRNVPLNRSVFKSGLFDHETRALMTRVACNPGYYDSMSSKAKRTERLMAGLEAAGADGRGVDRHYAGYFECFNRGLFYEAHDVLEPLWLAQRKTPNDFFYKGLIQLAGAFVHLRKDRTGPAAALFKLARTNLRRYPAVHERLDVREVLVQIERWLGKLEKCGGNPLAEDPGQLMELLSAADQKLYRVQDKIVTFLISLSFFA
jgi:hypothetical protein